MDSYRFSWKEEQVDIIADRLHQEKDGLKCELTVSTSRAPAAGLLRQGNFNVSSPVTRSQWEKALDQRLPEVDWYGAMEQLCALSLKRWRDGEPVQDLATVQGRSGVPFLLPPFVVEGATTVLFAEGGTGKSLLALAMGVSIATGIDILDSTATRLGPVLYLDWEWDAESHAERLKAICAGVDIAPPTNLIHYRHEVAPIWEAAPAIRRIVAELGIVFVVIDSLGFARGGEPESADLTLKTFAALRTFGVPILCLDHVAKNAADKRYSFGSVYTTNAARMTWRADAVKTEGESRIKIGMSNQKANGRFQKPRGFQIDMEIDTDDKLLSAIFTPTDIRDVPGLSKALPLADHIEAILLANRGHMDIEGILQCLDAEGANTTKESVRVTLYRHSTRFVKHGNEWACLAKVGV